MKSIDIKLVSGKWYFNSRLYKDLSGIEKDFVDKMLIEVKIEAFKPERTANNNLKNYNHKFR